MIVDCFFYRKIDGKWECVNTRVGSKNCYVQMRAGCPFYKGV